MKYRDLRDFVAGLTREGELKRIADPVSVHLDMTAICDRVLRAQGPALWFERPVGRIGANGQPERQHRTPVLANLFGTPKRVALGMGASDVSELRDIGRLPEAASLAAANKRIHNILRQAGEAPEGGADPALLESPAERELAEVVATMAREVQPLLAAGEYPEALTRLAGLRESVDRFFDEVMVMVDDERVRRNRLALLAEVNGLFLRAADVSRLQA